jgi:simple sugar transport system ATP-binding protein
MSAASRPPRVSLEAITKRFGSFVANDSVDFELGDQEIHAVLGENGAGKSTLMNILYGLYRPDSGTIRLDGETVHFTSPRDAIAHRIGMVHQHFMLVPALTVLENIVLGLRSRHEPLLDLGDFRRQVIDTARSYNLVVDVDARVSQLPVGVQQRAEILKALFRGARILILDEPTAVLTPQEVDEFFDVLKGLREAGYSIVLITHKLHEVMALCDRVTVLRGGHVAGVERADNVTQEQLARMMVGRDLPRREKRPDVTPGAAVLEIDELECLNARNLAALRGISLDVKRGEIVGVAGVDGNGQSELAEIIAGLRAPSAGRVRINGRDCTGATPRQCIAAGLGHVPQDRQRTGMVPELSIAENLILQTHADAPFARWGTLDRDAIASNADHQLKAFSIQAGSRDTKINTLSGGNQQKVILAREFSRHPEIMVAVQPTRGLDIAAAQFVHEQLLAARAANTGVLLISTELDEIMELSDRIAVLFEGRIVGVLDSATASREQVGLMMVGHDEIAEARAV